VKTIDIHTHGIGGFDTQTASQDDILHIAEIHGSYGVSEIILTVYPSAIKTMRENMLAIKKAMEIQSAVGAYCNTPVQKNKLQAKIIGVHLEGPFLNSLKCGALDARAFLKADEYSLTQLVDGFEDVTKIITIAPEIEGAVKLIKKISGMGIIASMGHSDATYSEAEAGFHAGARGLTHIFNAMRGIHHREPGISGFGLMNKDIYIEVIADFFHLDKIMLEFIYSVKDPERIILVSDTVKDSKKGPYSRGIKDEQGKLLGGCMTVQESSEELIQMGLDNELVLKSISVNPQRYLQES
jgi:N-acetylglucosamine-6-phosphate deacetylase